MLFTIFENQYGENRDGFSKDLIKEMVAKMGLNQVQFDTCLDSGKHEQMVMSGLSAACNANVQSTPSFSINGKLFSGILSVTDFRKRFSEIAPDLKVE